MREFEMKLKVSGKPGSRKSTFLYRLKRWISSQDDLNYRTVEDEEHTLKIKYKEW